MTFIKFTSNNQTIYTIKQISIHLNVSKFTIQKLMNNNPFHFNNQAWQFIEVPKQEVVQNINFGRKKGTTGKLWNSIPKKRNQPVSEDRENTKPPENPYYYQTIGNFIIKKSTLTNRIVSTSMI